MLVLLLQVEYQMTLSSARALWGCALGGPAKGRPALHDRNQCSGTPPLPGVPPYAAAPRRGMHSPPVDKGDRSLSPSSVCLFCSLLRVLLRVRCGTAPIQNGAAVPSGYAGAGRVILTQTKQGILEIFVELCVHCV